MIFKCLSKLQTSGTRQSLGALPPPSPPTLRPQGKAWWLLSRVPSFCKQNSCEGPTQGHRTPHRAGLSLLCCCFRGFLSMGSWSWFRENVGGPLSKVCSY